MKLTRFLPLIAAALLAAPTIQAGEGGPYVSLDGGAFFMDDIGTPLGSLDTDTGFGINAAVGYHLADLSLLLELNSGYYNADFGGKLRGVNVNGDLDLVPIMVNAKFEVPLVGCLSLELGAGLGIVYTHADASASFRGFSASASDSDWNFGFQALGGLNFKLCEAASLRAGYRFFYVDEDDIQGHFLGGGLTVRF